MTTDTITITHNGNTYRFGYNPTTGLIHHHDVTNPYGENAALYSDPRIIIRDGGPGTYGHTDAFVKGIK